MTSTFTKISNSGTIGSMTVGANTGKCKWTEAPENWGTSCDNEFILNDGSPEKNGMIYCCYCGRKIEEECWKNE